MPWRRAAAACVVVTLSGSWTSFAAGAHGLLRVAAHLHHPPHPVPGSQVRNGRPHGFHDPGAFHSGRERGGDRIQPGAVVGVDEVHPGGFDPDEGVVGTGSGLGDGAEGHHLGTAGLLNADGSGHVNPFG